MKKQTRNILITILIITGLTYIPSLTFPLFAGPKIELGRSYTATQSEGLGYYRLQVSKGAYYTFSIQWEISGFTYPVVKIYSSSLKLYGIQRISYSRTDFSLRFQAKHNGLYYVTIDLIEGGIIHLNLKEISQSEYYILNYNHELNFRRIIFYSVSALLCLVIVIIPPFMRFVGRKKKEYEESLNLYCPDCGVKLRKNIEYCNHCGHTFVSPKTNKY